MNLKLLSYPIRIPFMMVITTLLFFGHATAQQTSCTAQYEERNNLVVIEAENINPKGLWSNASSASGFTGTGYMQWGRSEHFASPGTGLISIKIKINNPGIYLFQWRSKIGHGSSTTDENDSWVRFPDASNNFATKGGPNSTAKIYPLGSGKTPNPKGAGSNNWWKVYTNTIAWNWTSNTSDNDPHAIYAQFDTPGIYTLEISARSKFHFIDRIVLSKSVSNSTSLSHAETRCTGSTVSYNITSSAGTGGTISPSGTTSVAQGSSRTYTITPNSGFAISNVVVNGASQGAISTYTFTNVTAAQTISATFSAIQQTTHAITSSAGSGGTITPSGTRSVAQGTSQSYTITPNTGFVISNVVVDGSSRGAISTYTFSNVTAPHSISATFTAQAQGITLSLMDANSNQALLELANGTQVQNNNNGLFSIRATSSATVGSMAMTLSGPININVTENIAPYALFGDTNGNYNGRQFPVGNYTISASAYSGTNKSGTLLGTKTIQFTVTNTSNPTSYNITSSAGSGGTISPSGTRAVTQGGSQSYTISANSGFTIANVTVNGVSQGAISSYTFTNVTAAQTISATFTAQAQGITLSLMDANSNQALLELANGTQVQNNNNGLFSIRATSSATVGSMAMTLSGPININVTENIAPYALFGDTNGNYNGRQFPVGNYTISASAYSGTNKSGTLLGTKTLQFTVTNTSNPTQGITFTLINANSNQSLIELNNGTQFQNNNNALFSIEATSSMVVGSVVMTLSGPVNTNITESIAPYALFADTNGKYHGRQFPVGNYTLTASTYSGAKKTGTLLGTRTIQFTVAGTGNFAKADALKEETVNADHFVIFPNPASSEAHIRLSNPDFELVDITIYDMGSRLIKTYNAEQLQPQGSLYKLNVSELAEGLYFLNIRTSGSRISGHRLVIKK